MAPQATVTNKTGHRFPTGVGFRRAFLELLVIDSPRDADRRGQIVWSSGQTNSLGVLVDRLGQPLATESFDTDSAGAQSYQPHHEEIHAETQVQIYESLMCDAQERFTTSFLHACSTRKDNRLLPRGFDKARADEDVAVKGEALGDPDFLGGSDRVRYSVDVRNAKGELRVEAELWYQPIAFRWARNLAEYRAAETDRFVGYYEAMSQASATVLARASATVP